MSATPTSDGLNRIWRRIAVLAFLTVCAPIAQAEEEGADFFSYRPSLPELRLPDIDLVPFWTDDLKKAKRAYRKGDHERAIRLFRRESEEGNIVADWYLGHIYRTGRGVPVDDATAYSYYARVADSYDVEEPDQNRLRIMVDAMLRVADYHRKGVDGAGIRQDPAYAVQTYLKLATTYGHPAAQYSLGTMHIKGEGVRENPQQGLKWLMAAARKRYALSEAYLGDLYWEGRLVRQDRTRGYMWYILAQEALRNDDHPEIAQRYERMQEQITEDERLEAEARARIWAERYPVEPNAVQ
ncbi:MAG: sel1 repeat family protein [Rhizobiales bacterium]|nr:sel1 repeat family protein [Hyphomicrobiales bacterium]